MITKLDSFSITIIFIILAALVAAFIRRIKKDKCLRDFTNDFTNLIKTDGRIIWGKLKLESTGLELLYQSTHKNADGHDETSYILYKNEYQKILKLVRFHDELTEKGKKEREKELKKTYHPRLHRRIKRKIANIFRTVRDSVVEVLDLLISRVKKTTGFGTTLTSQDKYVTQMKQELLGSTGTSYEPLLEQYIGHKVVLELFEADNVIEYAGILKDYTADFIEIMDVNYKMESQETVRKADMVFPRQLALVRHKGE